MTRVVVVGAGLAGAMAAVAAARAGSEVTLVAPRPGASALVGGALGLGADLDRLPPGHPLLALELDPVRLAGEVEAGVAELTGALGRGGAAVAGDWRRPALYADIHGRARTAALVPAAAVAGELGRLRAGRRPVVVVGFEHVSEYDAASTAEALSELAGISATSHVVIADGLPPGASIADLNGRAAPAVKAPATAVIAYPPGLVDLPGNGFELLAMVPSPFGLRVHRALEAAVAASGVERMAATVRSLATSGSRVDGVVTDHGGVHARSVVLATGRFIGGGLDMRRVPSEPLAGLAAWSGAHLAGGDRTLSHRLHIDPGVAFELGIRTDRRLRPLDAGGRRPAFDNLWAAGALLGGHRSEASALLAAVTGRLAGTWAAAA